MSPSKDPRGKATMSCQEEIFEKAKAMIKAINDRIPAVERKAKKGKDPLMIRKELAKLREMLKELNSLKEEAEFLMNDEEEEEVDGSPTLEVVQENESMRASCVENLKEDMLQFLRGEFTEKVKEMVHETIKESWRKEVKLIVSNGKRRTENEEILLEISEIEDLLNVMENKSIAVSPELMEFEVRYENHLHNEETSSKEESRKQEKASCYWWEEDLRMMEEMFNRGLGPNGVEHNNFLVAADEDFMRKTNKEHQWREEQEHLQEDQITIDKHVVSEEENQIWRAQEHLDRQNSGPIYDQGADEEENPSWLEEMKIIDAVFNPPKHASVEYQWWMTNQAQRDTKEDEMKQILMEKEQGELKKHHEEQTMIEEREEKEAIGTLDGSSVMKGSEDVSNVKVETVETITTVELVKQTTVQATGVASALVEQLQGMDFKLNNLSLRFEDEEEEEEEEELRRSMLMNTSSSKV